MKTLQDNYISFVQMCSYILHQSKKVMKHHFFLQENGVRDRARGGLIIAIEKRLELSLNSSILEYCGISNF